MRPHRLLALLLVFAMMMSLSACSSREIAVEDAEPDEETSDALNSDEPDEKVSTERIYAAYREIVREREETYGIGARSPDRPDSAICWMYGVACVRLWDLDGNGVEELLLWENTLTDNHPNMAQIEVWTYANGTAVELYCGSPCFGGDISGQSLELLTRDGETLLVTGTAAGEINLEYYAIRNGKMIRVHTLKDNAYDHSVCNYDEQQISSEEAWEIVSASVSLCNACVMTTAEAAAILRETEETRVVLGL